MTPLIYKNTTFSEQSQQYCMKKLFCPVLLLAALGAVSVQAADVAGLQISLIPDVALEDTATVIHGLTIDLLCGENQQIGITLGGYHLMTDESEGFAWGVVNYADSYTGVNWGLVNLTQHKFSGWQDGLINYAGVEFTGLQSGIINIAGHSRGLQWGVFNYADTLDGLQIGVLNIATDNRWFNRVPNQFGAAVPFVNWSF